MYIEAGSPSALGRGRFTDEVSYEKGSDDSGF